MMGVKSEKVSTSRPSTSWSSAQQHPQHLLQPRILLACAALSPLSGLTPPGSGLSTAAAWVLRGGVPPPTETERSDDDAPDDATDEVGEDTRRVASGASAGARGDGGESAKTGAGGGAAAGGAAGDEDRRGDAGRGEQVGSSGGGCSSVKEGEKGGREYEDRAARISRTEMCFRAVRTSVRPPIHFIWKCVVAGPPKIAWVLSPSLLLPTTPHTPPSPPLRGQSPVTSSRGA